MKTLIIGGGAAGASAAARLRRLDENQEILILEKTNEISIASCGLPYYVSETIQERAKMLVSNPKKFKTWFNIDIRLNTEVVSIDAVNKYVELKSTEKISYDRLILALGASPIIPSFKGENSDKIFTIKTLKDADQIKATIKTTWVKKVIVVGGGFIGIEMAENLVKMGLETTIVELGKQILTPLDMEMAALVQKTLIKEGVQLILSDEIVQFNEQQVLLKSGKLVDYDLVILAIGVKPEIKLAEKAGLKINHGIIVDQFMRTSDPSIYAAGDGVEVQDWISGKNTLMPLAGPANRQGRIIADNIGGLKSTYKQSLGTSVLKVFNLTVASVGNNEKQLQARLIPYYKTYTVTSSHASYYPNATQTFFKLLFSPEGKILGAQAIGMEKVEKNIDIISAIIRKNGTVQDLIDFEHCYAPPYSSAKSAINILGMTADNILHGYLKPAYLEDLTDALLIDVRSKKAYAMGTIKTAVNVPIDQIRTRFHEIPTNQKVILFCNTGYTSYCALRILQQKGFKNVFSLVGGLEFYKATEKG